MPPTKSEHALPVCNLQLPVRYEGSDALAHHDSLDIARLHRIEDDDWDMIVHAKSQRRAIHDSQAAAESIHIGDPVETRRRRVALWVSAINSVDAVFCHQDDLGLNLGRAQGSS